MNIRIFESWIQDYPTVSNNDIEKMLERWREDLQELETVKLELASLKNKK